MRGAEQQIMRQIQISKLSAFFAASALCLGVLGCSESSQQTQGHSAPAPSVSVIVVDTQPFSASFDFVGRTEASSFVELRARVTGFLSEQLFVEGSEVGKSELLYQIETDDVQPIQDVG